MNDDDTRCTPDALLTLGTQQFSDISRQAGVANSIYVAPHSIIYSGKLIRSPPGWPLITGCSYGRI